MLSYYKNQKDDLMAKTVETDEERIERVYKVRDYVLEKIYKIIKNNNEYSSIINNLNKVSIVTKDEIYKIYGVLSS